MTEEIKKDLIKRIAQKNIVLFVGAGLSVNAGMPNWNQLIDKILDGLSTKESKSQKYKQALKDELFTPLDLLNKISHLRVEAIEILESEIRKYDNVSPLKIHVDLGQISNQIITTNYDTLIERALPEYEHVVYSNEYKVAKLSNYSKYIFKIHGDIHEPNKCILFPDEYDDLYSKEEKSSVFELRKIISDKSILFIGFSLNDPFVEQIFHHVNNLYSGFNPEHYVITTDVNRNWPKKINPIVLTSYSELENLLREFIKTKDDQTKKDEVIKAEIEAKTNTNITKISEGYDYDSPPTNKVWVGRDREIQNINNGVFKSVFITGIGGQGKSALAAHFIRNHFDVNTYEFADWRDFKEEANRFNTKIISIIRRLSTASSELIFEQLSNDDLVDVFFHTLNDRKIIFVFDNIDNYIDLETFKPTGSFGYFFEQIIARDHKSKFIFTCRPFIREAGVEFYQISLKGIYKDECFDLFKHYKIPVSDGELLKLSDRAHQLTKGHPLWLNLIAGQAIRGVRTVEEFMNEIEGKTTFSEDNFSSILSEKILSVVWESLNDKQKILIRGIAETVRPEIEDNLNLILESQLNPNQFQKSLRTLKNLNLIETLKQGEIELHPLVKEFVLTKYPKKDRAKFITLFVKYYDRFIYILKPNLSSKLSIQEFQNWTLKIELQINKNDFKSAFVALEEVSHSLLSAGYTEEYVRVAHRLFDAINWELAIGEEYSYFHSQLYNLATALTQLGNFNEANTILEKYKKIIPGKSANYLGYCSEKTYSYWYQKQFDKAIEIGEEGVELLEDSNLSDSYSLRHNLALANRDSNIKINVEKALKYFSHEEDPTVFINTNVIKKDLGGAFYGNIGKCLQNLDREEEALKFYFASLKLLSTEDWMNSILNIGYACYWIAELLFIDKKNNEGLHFLKYAQNCWKKTSPPRVKEVLSKWDAVLIDIEVKSRISQMPDWKIKSFCISYAGERLL